MQASILATLCVLLVAYCPAKAAERFQPEPLITLTLQGIDLAAAVASLSAQSGRPIEVTNDVATALGPDISVSQMPLPKAIQTLADAYRVCYVVRPALRFQSCGGGEPPKAFLGLMIGSQAGADAPREGAPVILVISNSAADRAGVLQGDNVVSFNGRPIEVALDLVDAVSKIPPGTLVALEVVRNDQRLSLTAQF